MTGPRPSRITGTNEALWDSLAINRRQLWSQAISLTKGDTDQANDLLSLTIVKVAYHLHRRKTVIREPGAFLACALRHEFIGQCRKRKFEQQLRNYDVDVHGEDAEWLTDDSPDPEAALCEAEAVDRLELALLRLPERHRDLCRMRFYEERSYQEIAQALNISEALARKRVQLLRERLRELLGTDAPCPHPARAAAFSASPK